VTDTGPLTRALAAAVKDARPSPRDAAALALARRYAQLIDAARGELEESDTLDRLGPKLLAALSALGLTLAGRGTKAKGGDQGGSTGSTALDELRQRRLQRDAG
jgi:hypothetical protein